MTLKKKNTSLEYRNKSVKKRQLWRLLALSSDKGIIPQFHIAYMQGESKERWLDVCAQVVIVEDPDRLLELTREIIRMLSEKERRLTQQQIESADRSVIPQKKPPEIAVTMRSLSPHVDAPASANRN